MNPILSPQLNRPLQSFRHLVAHIQRSVFARLAADEKSFAHFPNRILRRSSGLAVENGLVESDETFVGLVTCLVYDVGVEEGGLVLEEEVAVVPEPAIRVPTDGFGVQACRL